MSLLDLAKTEQRVEISRESSRKPSKRIIPRPNNSYKFFIVGEDTFVTIPTHYVFSGKGGAYIRHIDNCPVCERNERIMEEHPEDYRSRPDFSPVINRTAVLVYDITEYRYCENCGTENSTIETKCWRCKRDLNSSPERANVLKSLVLSYTQAVSLSKSLQDFISETGAKFGEFYTKMSVTRPSGGRNVLSFTHFPVSEDKRLKVGDDFEFDPDILEKYSVLDLNREEIIEFMDGTSIKDILAGRNLKVEKKEEVASEEVEEKVDDIINSMFGD